MKSLNEIYIEKLLKTKTDHEVDLVFNEVLIKGFIHYTIKEIPEDQLKKEYLNLSIADKKQFIKEILDKNLLYLSSSEIEDTDYKIDKKTKLLNQLFYSHVPS